jgi:hypothetical protein
MARRPGARRAQRTTHNAGIKRDELHRSTPTPKALTFHERRTMGLPWVGCAGCRQGADTLNIQQRAGRSDYNRLARRLRLIVRRARGIVTRRDHDASEFGKWAGSNRPKGD